MWLENIGFRYLVKYINKMVLIMIMDDKEASKKAKECLKERRKFKSIKDLGLIKIEKHELSDGRWKFILSFYLENKTKKYLVEIGDKTGKCLKFEPLH